MQWSMDAQEYTRIHVYVIPSSSTHTHTHTRTHVRTHTHTHTHARTHADVHVHKSKISYNRQAMHQLDRTLTAHQDIDDKGLPKVKVGNDPHSTFSFDKVLVAYPDNKVDYDRKSKPA